MDVVPGAVEDEELNLREPVSTNDPITLFVSIVKESWNTQLKQDTYINRYYACCIRNLIRHHMTSFNFRTATEFYEQIINYETLIKSNSYKDLMSYNRGEFLELLQQIPNHSAVDTIGKYIAFLTMFLITTSKERIKINKGDVDKVYETLKIIRHRYINIVTKIHAKYKCKNMFIGIPCYMFLDYDGPEELIKWGNGVLNKSYMKIYNDYINYLKVNSRNPGNIVLLISFAADTWGFNNSIPEYVLKGLCFRHDDIINVNKNVKVRFYLRYLPSTNQYVYYDIDAVTRNIKFPPNIGVRYDVFAVSMGNQDDEPNKPNNLATTYKGQFYSNEKVTNSGIVKLDDKGTIPKHEDEKDEPKLPMDEAPIDNGDDDSDDDVIPDECLKQGNVKQKALLRLERRLSRVENDHVEVAKSCSIIVETIDRLERHADTLRQSMVNLAKKIDYQTGYGHMYLE